MDEFSKRLAAVPPEILELARQGCFPNAPLSEVLSHAESLVEYFNNGCKHRVKLDSFCVSPFHSYREVKLILLGLHLVKHQVELDDTNKISLGKMIELYESVNRD